METVSEHVVWRVGERKMCIHARSVITTSAVVGACMSCVVDIKTVHSV